MRANICHILLNHWPEMWAAQSHKKWSTSSMCSMNKDLVSQEKVVILKSRVIKLFIKILIINFSLYILYVKNSQLASKLYNSTKCNTCMLPYRKSCCWPIQIRSIWNSTWWQQEQKLLLLSEQQMAELQSMCDYSRSPFSSHLTADQDVSKI